MMANVAGAVTIAGVVLGFAAGKWLDTHRVFLGIYFVVWGAAWAAGCWAMAHDVAYLKQVSQLRSGLVLFRRRRAGFVERDMRYQQRMLEYLYAPVGLFIVFSGVWMIVVAARS